MKKSNVNNNNINQPIIKIPNPKTDQAKYISFL